MEKKTKNILEYTVVFQKAPEGGYTVTVPALAGCISEGDTFEQAADNIKEAIELYLEVASKGKKVNFAQVGEIFSAPIKVRV